MKSKKKSLIELAVLIVIVAVSAPLLRPKIAGWLSNKGVDYCNIGEIDKAIPFFKNSLKIRPDPQVHCNLANAYREKKMMEESIVEYNRALQLDPNYIPAYYGLGYVYEEEGMYKEALSYLEKAESLGSQRVKEELEEVRLEYATSLFNEAADFYIGGDKDRAELRLREVLELAPDFAFAYKILGDIEFSRNQFAEAVVNYKQTVKLGLADISIYNLYNDIGMSYVRLEDYNKALKYLRKAYNLEPDNADILYNLASTLRDNRNFDEALQNYKKLVRRKFDYPNIHNDMAGIYRLLNKREEAEREYKNEISIVKAQLLEEPGDVYILNRLALAYNGLGQYEEAKKIMDNVIKKRPDYGEAFYTRAKIYENLREVKKAFSDSEKARSLLPRSRFIDNYVFRLKTKRIIPKDKESFPNDTIICLTNGRTIQGRLKKETDERIFLEVMVGNSFGTIAVSWEDIESLKKFK